MSWEEIPQLHQWSSLPFLVSEAAVIALVEGASPKPGEDPARPRPCLQALAVAALSLFV